MVFKIECGPDYKGSKTRNNGEYLPFVKVPTDALPIGSDVSKFASAFDKVGVRRRWVIHVRVHALDGSVILQEDPHQGATPPPALKLLHEQLSAMDKGGLEVVVYNNSTKAQDVCLIKP